MRDFDTYTHINELKKAGFKEEQAAVIIKSLMDSRETDISHLATKEQVRKLETSTKEQVRKLEASTKEQVSKLEASTNARFAIIEERISSLRNEMKAMILDTHTSTLKWMVGTMIALVGIIIAAIKLF